MSSSNNLQETSGGGNNIIDSKNDGPEMTASSGETPPANAAAAAASSMASFKLMLLIGMVLQNSSTVLVGRYTRAGVPKADQYDVNHLIVVIELGKLLLSAALEFHTTHGKLVQSLQTHILDRPMDALMILVPALLYLVQNTLLYVALTNLAAPIFQVTYQAKLVTTAIVSVFMLQRSYSVQQWVCLVLLSLGVAVVVLGEGGGTKTPPKEGVVAQSLTLGLTAVTIACFSSALAGVYFEKVLKNPASSDATKAAPASLWMRNIQLSFFSIIIALGQGYFAKAPEVPVPYLHGFTAWAWILVLLQAGGGLLVAAVIKYADNVLKGLATGVSVVLATMVSTVLFATPLTFQFSVGATMILGSVYYFSNPLPGFAVGSSGKKEENVEVKSLLPK
jgi:solute carrier family 35 (UDP-sugar transporter), member A1/2/3